VVQYVYMRQYKNKVISLRKKGKTYSEIKKIIGKDIPKSTLSFWCNGIKLPEYYEIRISDIKKKNLAYAQLMASKSKQKSRENYFSKIEKDNKNLTVFLKNEKVAKLLLATLYLAEGGKKTKGSVMFGNSDPGIIKLFLNLLHFVYPVDDSKFRCTVQCRADQDINKLEIFWQKITNVPVNQFYKTRIDSRSIGKRTMKVDYKGVCKIDYFSADIFYNLMIIGKLITN